MRGPILAVLAAAALAAPSGALAAYTPTLLVSHEIGTTGGQTATTIRVTIPRTDDATAKVQLLVPVDYQLTLTATPGSVVGSAQAQVLATAISPDTIAPLEGPIRAADPAQHTANQCAPGTHTAVWIAELSFSGQTIPVPIYIDQVPAANQQALGASHTIQTCFSSPHIPQSAGGAPLGAKVLSATLALSPITRTPPRTARHVWRGVFTPYVAGTATPNAAGTVEAQSIVGLPKLITLRVVVARRRTVRLSGQLTEGGAGLAGATVQILRTGGNRGRLSLRVFARRTTDASGRYAHQIRFRRPGSHRFQVRAVVQERNLGAAGCVAPSIAPAGCVSATAAGFRVQTAPTRLLRVR